MTTARIIGGALLVGLGLAAMPNAHPALAQANDWPCVQRLVPELEAGQMWSGPALPALGDQQPPPEVHMLAERLADVKTAPETVEAEVKAFADSQPADQRRRRWASCSRSLRLAQRASVDPDRRHQALCAGPARCWPTGRRGDAGGQALSRQPTPDAARIDDLQTARAWDTRVFTDRQRQLRLVCDQPVLLEQRAFALARIIQEQLK